MLKANIHTLLPIALSVILPGLSLYSNSVWGLQPNRGFFFTWAIASAIMYLMWYVLWFLWDGKRRKINWWRSVALVMMLGAIVGLLHLGEANSFEGIIGANFVRLTLTIILFLSIQYALKAQQNISGLQLEKEQLQTENYRVQLKALRAKIDPHFLFNSLNTLRSMVRQQHPNSEQFIVSLSQFFRQTLKHNENTTLRLSEELAVLESYLFVMKSRNEEAISLNIRIHPDKHELHLPTLALQVVVENCFKHNSMTSSRPLRIGIQDTEDFYLEVRNNIQPKLGEQEPSGLGLEMLRKRYELLNVSEGVVIQQTPDHFSVRSSILYGG